MPPKNKPGGIYAPKKEKIHPRLTAHPLTSRSLSSLTSLLSSSPTPHISFPFITYVSSFFIAYPREPGSIPGSRLLRSAPLTYDVSHVYWPLVHVCLQE